MTEPSAPPVTRAERRRAAQEQARLAAQRRRFRAFVAAGVAVVLVLVAAGVVWAVNRDDSPPTASPSASPTDTGPTQPTLLVQLRGADGLAVANALLVVGGPLDHGTMVLIPSNLYVDVATGGNLPLGEVARLPDPNASADALSDLLGLRIDGSLVMNTVAFAGMVDAVGGVVADVDVDVLDTETDGTVVAVPVGSHLLDGLQASQYASYLAPGEAEQARLARFQQVFRLVLAKLPEQANQIDPILTSLGSLARSTVPTTEVGDFLARLRVKVLADEVDYPALPLEKIETGGSTDAYSVDLDSAVQLKQTYLPEAVRVPGPNSKVRVLVQNGRLVPGLGAAARSRLVDGGYTYVFGGNAPTPLNGPTQIVVPDATAESLEWGAGIAAALEVPESDVRVATEGQSVADVIVVLGTDFVADD